MSGRHRGHGGRGRHGAGRWRCWWRRLRRWLVGGAVCRAWENNERAARELDAAVREVLGE